jgi:hypothetical protein
MSVTTLPIDPETLLISSDEAREYGRAAAEGYRTKKPYPYGCFDNFMPPEILERVRESCALCRQPSRSSTAHRKS